MSSLANIQQVFSQSIREHRPQDLLQRIKGVNPLKEPFLKVYHNRVYTIHSRALEEKYPLVFSRMGSQQASIMAKNYTRDNFPYTGSLEDWGKGFPGFIQNYEPAAAWPYLTDIAHYEWAWHQAYCAPEDPLAEVDDKDLLLPPNQREITFSFQKSCSLMAFSYPIEHIIADIGHSNNILKSVTPLYPAESSYALIFKHQGIVKVNWLTPSLFVFLNRLKEGQDSEVASAAARVVKPDFDVEAAFRFLMANPLLNR